MVKKKRSTSILIILAILFITNSVSAQIAALSGKIVDEKTGESVPFASVSVFDINFNSLLDGAMSDEDGNFKIVNLGFEPIQVVVSFIGYTPDTIAGITISAETEQVNLGEIRLKPAVFELQGVEVQGFASATTRQIDRQTYRPGDFETTRGGTAIDVLSRLPALSVDPDGTVSLRGTTDFMVYLNGKPTQIDPSVLLGQIPANSIESIEVITVPTARFEAQGAGGIINITTKRSGIEGLSVVSDGLLGGAPWADKTHKFSGQNLNYNRWGGGINLIYQKNDLTLFGGLNHVKRNLKSYRIGDARLLQADGSYYHMVADGERLEWQQNYSANIGLDYQLNPTSMLSAFYYFGHRNEGRTAHYIYNNFFGDINKNPVDGIDSQNRWVYNPNTDDRTGVFHTTNIDYTKIFSNNSQLLVSFLYEHSGLSWTLDNPDYDFDVANDLQNELISHFYQSDDVPLDGFRLTIDYEKEFDNGHSLGFGFHPQYLKQTGGFHFDTLNVATNTWGVNQQFLNDIDLSRGIYAGYADYSGNFGKLQFVAGLRIEYTDQTLELDNPDYLNIFQRPTKPVYEVEQLDWFPTLHMRYGFNERNALILAASRRINRPPTKNMAPFLYRRHHEVYVVGDPELKPEYLTNAEISLQKGLGEQQFTLTGFYRGTDNAIFRVNTVYEEENVLIRSFTNAGNVQALGAELNANLSAGSFAKFFVGGSLYDFNVQGDIFGFQENNRSTNWSLKGNMNLFLTQSVKFTADLDLRSATVTTQGRDEMFYVTNAALNYTPAKLQGWDFGVKVIDVLSSNVQALYTRAYNAAGTQIFYQDAEFDRSGPIIEITASYSFNMNGRSGRKADSTFGREQF
jgi:outer membrane receptor protein involved in Fe transport